MKKKCVLSLLFIAVSVTAVAGPKTIKIENEVVEQVSYQVYDYILELKKKKEKRICGLPK